VERVKWRVCSSSSLNILLELPSLGYPLHGHDVVVEACISADRRGIVVYDMEALRSMLMEMLDVLDGQRLSHALGLREASLEDLVLDICRRLVARLRPEGLGGTVEVKASVPGGSVSVECTG